MNAARQESLPRPAGFARDESGAATLLALFFILIFLVMGGLAIDFNKAMANRTELQIAADTAAHAALYTRDTQSETIAISTALDTVSDMLPVFNQGNALLASDIEFGTWTYGDQRFTPDSSSKTAVRVTTEMSEDRSNAVRNILLRIIGRDTFDVTTRSVYVTYMPPCFREGFVADDVVEIQSNNSYFDGFCLHSNNYVKLSSNNFFQEGTVVSMPTLSDLQLPNSGFETNLGLQAALRQGDYRLRLLRRIPAVIEGLKRGDIGPMRALDSAYPPPGYVSAMPIDLASARLDPADFALGGRIYTTSRCQGGRVTLEPGTYSDIIFVTSCEINLANGVILDNTVLATSNTGVRSINGSHAQLGLDDNCASGGGALLMTLGGFYAAEGLSAFGAQILAHDDIQFAANADGVEGVSFQSYGRIDGTSNMNMGYCGKGLDHFLAANYFRMVD